MATELIHWLGLDYLLNPQKRMFWGYLLLSLLIAVAYLRFSRQPLTRLFSTKIWWHPSARLDYRYFLVSSIIKISLVLPLLVSVNEVALRGLLLLEDSFGYQVKLEVSKPVLVLAYTFSLFLFGDFTRYWLHRLMHRWSWLWAFHKVHHSAEVLTPATFYRVHPLENLLFGFRYALSAGLVTAVFVYFFGAALSMLDILGVNAFVFAAHVVGDNLRHSPVALRYPAWLERILISPAQHQYHHTVNGSRRNYGGVLAVWDGLFGSLRISAANDSYNFGVLDGHQYRSLTALILLPFQQIYSSVRVLVMSNQVRRLSLSLIALVCVTMVSLPLQAQTTKAQLGRLLFFDKNLSKGRNQSCSSCHNPEAGFVDARDNGVNAMASLGDDGHSLGDRQAPTASYARFSPAFHYDEKKKQYVGGQFWDGRAKDLQAQAGGPPLNPIEMAMPNKASVIERLKENSFYVTSLKALYGDEILDDDEGAYEAMTDSIAAFEKTGFFAPFDSKYDLYLKGEYELTAQEELGMALFFSNNNTNCSTCHVLKGEDRAGETFTNYQFHNIGTPANPTLRANNGVAKDHIDHGLLDNPTVDDPLQDGKFKVPTLRNIAVTAPYMHNGVFSELRTVIEFYDQYNNSERKLNPETGQPWRSAEVEATINREDLKAKKLTDAKVDALIAFLKLLTDHRYQHKL